MEKTNVASKPNVLDYERSLLNAIQHSDAVALNELLHEQLLHMHPSGQVLNKQMYLNLYKQNEVQVESAHGSDYLVNEVDDVAVVSVLVTMEWGFSAADTSGTYRYIRVWKLVDQKYKLLTTTCIAVSQER